MALRFQNHNKPALILPGLHCIWSYHYKKQHSPATANVLHTHLSTVTRANRPKPGPIRDWMKWNSFPKVKYPSLMWLAIGVFFHWWSFMRRCFSSIVPGLIRLVGCSAPVPVDMVPLHNTTRGFFCRLLAATTFDSTFCGSEFWM